MFVTWKQKYASVTKLVHGSACSSMISWQLSDGLLFSERISSLKGLPCKDSGVITKTITLAYPLDLFLMKLGVGRVDALSTSQTVNKWQNWQSLFVLHVSSEQSASPAHQAWWLKATCLFGFSYTIEKKPTSCMGKPCTDTKWIGLINRMYTGSSASAQQLSYSKLSTSQPCMDVTFKTALWWYCEVTSP